MKDLLLFVPLDDFAKAQYEYIPLGVLYLASFIEEAGFEVDVVHGRTEDIKSGYRYYGVSSTTAQYSYALDALKRIKEIEPIAKTIVGGPHFKAEECLNEACGHGWDHVVIGDGEFPLLHILTGQISDIAIWGTTVEDLDSYPLPAFHKLNLSKYNYPLRNDLKCINLLTSRGCPYECQYCSTSKTKLRYHSPDRVLEMAETLMGYGFNSFMIADDNMSMNKNRFYDILSGLESLDVKWRSLIRAETINQTGLEKMVRSGCVEVGPGIESGSQKILDIVKKRSKVDRNLKFIQDCENAGIRCVPSFIIGLPGETSETVKDTYEFMKKAKPSAFAYNILMPFPDSPIYQKKDTEFKDLITIYPYTWDDCVTKCKKITQCFVSTPSFSREQILEEYYKYYDIFADMTAFDPRKRGNRK
jgi:radical SAM superfamily enzyme YgiQ (UPF0313 family)